MSEQPKTLSEELRTLEEEEQTEELAVRALKMLVVRALKEKHWICGQASLA